MRSNADGDERICTTVAALVDTNILIYRFDSGAPRKQAAAAELLRRGIAEDWLRLPHQAIVEFVNAVTRRRGATPALMTPATAYREAEEILAQFIVLYPNESLVRVARRLSISALLVRCPYVGLRRTLQPF